jgi:hypothetical protein
MVRREKGWLMRNPLRRRAGLWPAAIFIVATATSAGGLLGQDAARRWVDQRAAGRFVVRSSFPLTEQEVLLGELTQLERDLARALNVEPARQPVELYLFADKGEYRNSLRNFAPNVADRRALFLKGSGPGRVFVYRSGELAVDVRHECTHALLHASLPMVPLWLDEGLAEYFELPGPERAFRRDYLDKLKWNARLGAVPRLAQLEETRDLAQMREADYRHAWAWVHFMFHGSPHAHAELVDYLADIRAHTPPGRLSERLERRLPGVEKRMAEHLKAWPSRAPTASSR